MAHGVGAVGELGVPHTIAQIVPTQLSVAQRHHSIFLAVNQENGFRTQGLGIPRRGTQFWHDGSAHGHNPPPAFGMMKEETETEYGPLTKAQEIAALGIEGVALEEIVA